MESPSSSSVMPPFPPAVLETDALVEQLLAANTLEQAGQVTQAQQIYQEILAFDPDGTYGAVAARALDKLALPATDPNTLPASGTVPSSPTAAQLPWIIQKWRNFSFQNKLTTLILAGATLPIILITGANLAISQNTARQQFGQNLRQVLTAFQDEYIFYMRDDSLSQAKALAELIRISTINLNDTQVVNRNRVYLQTVLRESFSRLDETSGQASLTKSFRLLVNAQGVSVAQSIKVYADDFFAFPPLPDDTPNEKFLLAGVGGASVDISDVDIVETALTTGQPQTGIEILPSSVLQRLSLANQGQVPLRPEAGTTTYEDGLAPVAVYPLLQDSRVVGAVVVGSLLNRNLAITDTFSRSYEVPIVSLYSGDINVATTAPYKDKETRALGTRAEVKVRTALLEQNRSLFLTTSQIAGVSYLEAFAPLYDHRAKDPRQAKPVGMVAIGRPESLLNEGFASQIAVNIVIALATILVVTATAGLLAGFFSEPIQRLATFARRLGEGEEGIRLPVANRQDEIGILELQMNEMADNVEVTLNQIRQQESLRREEAEQQRQERERLQREVINLLLEIEGAQQGDLTVYAAITDGEVGSIADAFNATIRSLRQLVVQVKTVALQVNRLAQDSTRSVVALSHTAEQQSQEMGQTLTVVADINQSMQAVADSAHDAAMIAQKALQEAQTGDETMLQTVDTMIHVQAAVEDTALKIQRLIGSSQEIFRIATTISAIAERTNLIAYNASLEALRAGEQGAGFRVVADEVRRLAQQVSDSTHDIEQLVSTIQLESREVVAAMTVGTQEVVAGVTMIGQTQVLLQGLAGLSREIDTYLHQISQSVSQQSVASQHVNQAVALVAGSATINAQASQQVVQSLESLLAQVDTLQASVSKFQVEG